MARALLDNRRGWLAAGICLLLIAAYGAAVFAVHARHQAAPQVTVTRMRGLAGRGEPISLALSGGAVRSFRTAPVPVRCPDGLAWSDPTTPAGVTVRAGSRAGRFEVTQTNAGRYPNGATAWRSTAVIRGRIAGGRATGTVQVAVTLLAGANGAQQRCVSRPIAFTAPR